MKKTLTIAIVVMAGILLLGSVAFANTITVQNNAPTTYMTVTVNAGITKANPNYTFTILKDGKFFNSFVMNTNSTDYINQPVTLATGQSIQIMNTSKINNTNPNYNPMAIQISPDGGNTFFTTSVYFYKGNLNFVKSTLKSLHGNYSVTAANNSIVIQ